MMVELNTETMKISMLNEVDLTEWPTDSDEYEYTRATKLHTFFSDREIDSFDLAYNVFKNAKYVIQQNCIALAFGFIYEVKCTYASQDEQFDIMAYGEDDNFDY